MPCAAINRGRSPGIWTPPALFAGRAQSRMAMRYVLGQAWLLPPATAFARMFEGPSGSIPVAKCAPVSPGARCTPVVEGTGLTPSRGYTGVDRQAPARSARLAVTESKKPYLDR